MTAPVDIVNQAIQLMGANEPSVTGTLPSFDQSKAGQAAAALYTPCVQTVGRQFGWDFARSAVLLSLSGNPAPAPFAYEYLYPAGVQLWQIVPSVIVDRNNPLPVNWSVGNTIVGAGQAATQKKVVWTNLAAALAYYNDAPNENTWDPLFREAVVRLLASEMAMALAGKPDTSKELLESGGAMVNLAEGRSD